MKHLSLSIRETERHTYEVQVTRGDTVYPFVPFKYDRHVSSSLMMHRLLFLIDFFKKEPVAIRLAEFINSYYVGYSRFYIKQFIQSDLKSLDMILKNGSNYYKYYPCIVRAIDLSIPKLTAST